MGVSDPVMTQGSSMNNTPITLFFYQALIFQKYSILHRMILLKNPPFILARASGRTDK